MTKKDATHTITIPSKDKTHDYTPFSWSCSGCGSSGAAASAEYLGEAIARHVDPVQRAKDEQHAKDWGKFIDGEVNALAPYVYAIEAYRPLFAEAIHTGGGCMAIKITVEGKKAIGLIANLDGPWGMSINKNQTSYDEGWCEDESCCWQTDNIAPEDADPKTVAAAVVRTLQERKVLGVRVPLEA